MTELEDSKFTDLIGQRFGHLVVQEVTKVPVGTQMHYMALCVCGCGKTITTRPCKLTKGRIKSCGCRIGINLIGFKFATYTVIAEDFEDKSNSRMWICQCDCGLIRSCSSSVVRLRKITECLECYNRRVSKYTKVGEVTSGHWARIVRNAKHGKRVLEINSEYVWELFLKQNRRCALSGKLIVLADNVKSPKNTASLDRINSDLGYIKDNVQWVHKDINSMKSDFSDDEFIQWCHKVSDYQRSLVY